VNGDSAETTRRDWLKLCLLAPLGGLADSAGATDYTSATEVFAAIDRLEADVASRLDAIGAVVPGARPFVASALADQARHRAAREQLRRRLKVASTAPPARAAAADTTLDGLRAQQEALVYAHAEGLPALDDAVAVDTLARHMVELSRQLTVIDLWIEAEAARG
jgi:hypothetical protein